MAGEASDWEGYLAAFHEQRPGITEDVLTHARLDGVDAYQWLVEAVPPGADVLDLACGSGAVRSYWRRRWVGVDVSAAELEGARRRGRCPVVRGDAVHLPFAGQSFDAVVCSMALMLIPPLGAALAEVARVLRPGGCLAALVPCTGPLPIGDRLRYARLLLALRCRLRYPNDAVLADAPAVLGASGLAVTGDDRRRFVCPVTSPDIAVLCVRSLYLPDQPPERTAEALRVASTWVGSELGVPLRRLVAERA